MAQQSDPSDSETVQPTKPPAVKPEEAPASSKTTEKCPESVETLSENDIGGAVCVFYTKSPFSDFAPSPFLLDGRFYHSVEHFFQLQMLYSFGLFKLASQTIKIKEAAEFRKHLRTTLKQLVKSGQFDEELFSKWKRTNAPSMMRKGNRAKFAQNFQLRELLLQTGDRLLVFTSKNDRLLGVGMTEAEFLFWLRKNHVGVEQLLDVFTGVRPRPKELGSNSLGIALMDIRAELGARPSLLAEWRHRRRPPPHAKGKDGAKEDDKKRGEERERKRELAPLETRSVTSEEARRVRNASDKIRAAAAAGDRLTQQALAKTLAAHRRPFLRPGVAAVDQSEAASEAVDQSAVAAPPTVDQSAPRLAEPVDQSASTSSDQSEPPTKVIVLAGERRIVVQRGDAAPPVGGLPKLTRWSDLPSPAVLPASSEVAATGVQLGAKDLSTKADVLERLKALRFEKPMVNPFALNFKMVDERVADDLKEPEVLVRQPSSVPPLVPKGPKGRPYRLEQGEIPPEGVIPPPPGSAPGTAATILPLGYRDWIVRPPLTYRRPAALPPHLVPLPPPPPGIEPLLWKQRFAPPPPQWLTDAPLGTYNIPFNRYRMPLIRAPEQQDVERQMADPVWKPPQDPFKMTVDKAKEFVQTVAKRAQIAKERPRQHSSVEGATPATKPKGVQFSEQVDDARLIQEEIDLAERLAFDRAIFPFGMEANLPDLQDLGFVPPPIVGDPRAQARNKPMASRDWLTQFESPAAAIRHYANRWIKRGRLKVTGEYEECESDVEGAEGGSDDDREDAEEVLSDDEYKCRCKHVETQVVYVDTAQYDVYVAYYQKVHGFTPLPAADVAEAMRLRQFSRHHRAAVAPLVGGSPAEALHELAAAAPDQLYSHNWGDYWALSRWRWAQWERKLERGDDALHQLSAEQESWTDGVNFAGKPLAYEQTRPNTPSSTAEEDPVTIVPSDTTSVAPALPALPSTSSSAAVGEAETQSLRVSASMEESKLPTVDDSSSPLEPTQTCQTNVSQLDDGSTVTTVVID